MKGVSTAAASVDEYISRYPKHTQAMLKGIRKIIKAAAPEAEEMISYMMPGYKLGGPLVYFGGYEKHIGFYPGASGVSLLQEELEKYKISKGTIQIPLDAEVPEALITRIVKHRVRENLEKQAVKQAGKKKSATPKKKAGAAVKKSASPKKRGVAPAKTAKSGNKNK